MAVTSRIETIEDVYPQRYGQHASVLAKAPAHRWAALVQAAGQGSAIPPEQEIAKHCFAVAYVNGGRWVVECPVRECGGAQYASISDHRFLCHECHNVMAGGKPIVVIWPPAAKREQIEDTLIRRPFPATRNWTRQETLAALIAENEAHGISAQGQV